MNAESNIWTAVAWPTARVADAPPRVNISERIRHLSKRQRRAVADALERAEPEIALFVERFAETFGRMELYLDPVTAQRVLGVIDKDNSDAAQK